MTEPIQLRHDASAFLADIDRLVAGGLSHIDAVVHWCEQRGFEAEFGASLVKKSPALKKKIREEATLLNCMRKK